MFKKYQNILVGLGALILIISGVVFAGSITPSGSSPETTFYTLEDIYQKLTNANYTQTPTHSLLPGSISTDQTTMNSLTDIYDAVSPQTLNNSTTTMAVGMYATTTLSDVEGNLSEGNIKSGVTIFDKTGTFECTPPDE